jgi:hypothetical protein
VRTQTGHRAAKAHIVADLTTSSLEDILRMVKEKYGLEEDDLAFIWFSPPCETNSHMQHVNRARDRPENPVKWHRGPDGTPRPDKHGDTARLHDAMISRWAKILTDQWGPLRREGSAPPTSREAMPDEGPRLTLTYDPPRDKHTRPLTTVPRKEGLVCTHGRNGRRATPGTNRRKPGSPTPIQPAADRTSETGELREKLTRPTLSPIRRDERPSRQQAEQRGGSTKDSANGAKPSSDNVPAITPDQTTRANSPEGPGGGLP